MLPVALPFSLPEIARDANAPSDSWGIGDLPEGNLDDFHTCEDAAVLKRDLGSLDQAGRSGPAAIPDTR